MPIGVALPASLTAEVGFLPQTALFHPAELPLLATAVPGMMLQAAERFARPLEITPAFRRPESSSLWRLSRPVLTDYMGRREARSYYVSNGVYRPYPRPSIPAWDGAQVLFDANEAMHGVDWVPYRSLLVAKRHYLPLHLSDYFSIREWTEGPSPLWKIRSPYGKSWSVIGGDIDSHREIGMSDGGNSLVMGVEAFGLSLEDLGRTIPPQLERDRKAREMEAAPLVLRSSANAYLELLYRELGLMPRDDE